MINSVQNNDNSLLPQFLLANVDFPLLNKLNMSALLALACNRQLYETIHNYLLLEKSEEARNYQGKRIRKSFFDLKKFSDGTQPTPLQKLKQTNLSKNKVTAWLGRSDLTNEMRFYGLLYSALPQNGLPVLGLQDTHILENLWDKGSVETLNLEIIFPYLLPFISIEQKIKWLNNLMLPHERPQLFTDLEKISLFINYNSLSQETQEKIYCVCEKLLERL